MTDKERTDTQLATLYDLRLHLKNSDKENYSVQELFDLIDNIALEKSSK